MNFLQSIYLNLIRLIAILKKNFRTLLRSKSSALIVIFGPLLIIILLVVAFNSSAVFDVRIGVYSKVYSPLAESLLKEMGQSQYSVTKLGGVSECIDGVKKGDYNICLVFSPDIAINNNANNKITFYVDYTRVNLVYAVMDKLSENLAKNTDKLSLELTQIIVDELQSTKGEVANKLSGLNAVSANAASLNEKLTSISVSLNALDLQAVSTSAQLDGVKNQVSAVKAVLVAKNLSLDEVDLLSQSVDALGVKVQSDIQKMSAAKSGISASATGIGEVRTILLNDQKSLDAIRASLDQVTKSIDAVNVTNAENIVTPISTQIQPVVTQVTFLSRLFPTFLTIIVMFVCSMLAATLVINEKTTNASFRNFITPTSDSVFLIGVYLTSLVMVIFQLILVFLVAVFFLEAASVAVFSSLILPLFLIVSVFICSGILIGYVFNSQETSTLASLFFVSACLLFSNTILPIESIPGLVKNVFLWNPFVVSESLLRKILLFNLGWEQLEAGFSVLVIYLILFASAAYGALKFYKKKLRS